MSFFPKMGFWGPGVPNQTHVHPFSLSISDVKIFFNQVNREIQLFKYIKKQKYGVLGFWGFGVLGF
jgi:hypothetical protein